MSSGCACCSCGLVYMTELQAASIPTGRLLHSCRVFLLNPSGSFLDVCHPQQQVLITGDERICMCVAGSPISKYRQQGGQVSRLFQALRRR